MSEFRRSERELFPSKYATIGTRGRRKSQSPDEFRTDFQRDVHRIIYSQSFRRLRHKTQVFYFPQNDHVSTRMDHVRFVASAARTVARCLGLNEDLFDDLLKELRRTSRFQSYRYPENSKNNSVPLVYRVLQQFVNSDMKDVYTPEDPDELIVLDCIAGMTDNFAIRSVSDVFIPKMTV